MPVIKEVTIYYCKFPLKVTYKLSYGNITNYETLLFEVITDQNRRSYGEATFLSGYSNEKPDDCYDISTTIAREVLNDEASSAVLKIEKYRSKYPFLTTAISSCIEGLLQNYTYRTIEVPIIGLINTNEETLIEEQVESLVDNKYKVVKAKISYQSLQEDINKINLIDKYANGKLKIRVDANQSLEPVDIDYIIEQFSSIDLQFLEQPFSKNNWEKHIELQKRAPFPIMLDESIWDFSDIDLAFEKHAARYIKLKLQKCGGLSRFESMINYVKERDFNVIIGNGVQTHLNCILEGQVFDKCKLDEAAESIGFLKLNDSIIINKISVMDGIMRFRDCPIEVDLGVLDSYLIKKGSYKCESTRKLNTDYH